MICQKAQKRENLEGPRFRKQEGNWACQEFRNAMNRAWAQMKAK